MDTDPTEVELFAQRMTGSPPLDATMISQILKEDLGDHISELFNELYCMQMTVEALEDEDYIPKSIRQNAILSTTGGLAKHAEADTKYGLKPRIDRWNQLRKRTEEDYKALIIEHRKAEQNFVQDKIVMRILSCLFLATKLFIRRRARTEHDEDLPSAQINLLAADAMMFYFTQMYGKQLQDWDIRPKRYLYNYQILRDIIGLKDEKCILLGKFMKSVLKTECTVPTPGTPSEQLREGRDNDNSTGNNHGGMHAPQGSHSLRHSSPLRASQQDNEEKEAENAGTTDETGTQEASEKPPATNRFTCAYVAPENQQTVILRLKAPLAGHEDIHMDAIHFLATHGYKHSTGRILKRITALRNKKLDLEDKADTRNFKTIQATEQTEEAIREITQKPSTTIKLAVRESIIQEQKRADRIKAEKAAKNAKTKEDDKTTSKSSKKAPASKKDQGGGRKDGPTPSATKPAPTKMEKGQNSNKRPPQSKDGKRKSSGDTQKKQKNAKKQKQTQQKTGKGDQRNNNGHNNGNRNNKKPSNQQKGKKNQKQNNNNRRK